MTQISLAQIGFELASKCKRKQAFLDDVEQVIPWSHLLALIAPHASVGKTDWPLFALETMLGIHLLQQLFGHCDPAMEEPLHDTPLYREFARLNKAIIRLPDKSTILRFCHLPERNDLAAKIRAAVNARLMARALMLKSGTVVDAILIAAPTSTKNKGGQRDPEMHQTKKGNQRRFGMKTHIGVDADSGLVHNATAANAYDITQAHALLHGQEQAVFADSGYRGVEKREEVQDRHPDTCWHIAMMAGKRKALNKSGAVNVLIDQFEAVTARIRVKVEYPSRVIKYQFFHHKVRHKGLVKNTSQLLVMFTLRNLWGWYASASCKRRRHEYA